MFEMGTACHVVMFLFLNVDILLFLGLLPSGPPMALLEVAFCGGGM